MEIIDITPDNIERYGVFCGGNEKVFCTEGRKNKIEWYIENYKNGVRIKIACENNTQLGFIEYAPSESSWRPIFAPNYLIIHCLQVDRRHTRKGVGRLLLDSCKKELNDKDGIAIITSSRPWVNDRKFFKKHDFIQVEKHDPYFELMAYSLNPQNRPFLRVRDIDNKAKLQLYYSYQCPIVNHALNNLDVAANEKGVELEKVHIKTSEEAQNAYSCYPNFSLFKDGKFITHRIYSSEVYKDML